MNDDGSINVLDVCTGSGAGTLPGAYLLKPLDNGRAKVEDLRTGSVCIVETKYMEYCENDE
tara:strand:+ start:152 stop:334 length:183 start_codon:yes stop_codon:yes gene_type:complete